MALACYFTNEGFTAEKYAETLSRLESVGAGAPKGRIQHIALEADGVINVLDIWESQADFEAFGGVLLPILTDLGVELPTPLVTKVHNVIKG
jgi:hypothetical protein